MKLSRTVKLSLAFVCLVNLALVANWVAGPNVGEASGYDDERVYFEWPSLSPIEGTVMTTFVKTNERFPAGLQNIIFQRLDCKKSVYSAITDRDGRYSVRLAKGRYRVIVRFNSGPRFGESYDGLAPHQERLIESKISPLSTSFNIELISQVHPEKIELEMRP